MPSRYGFFGSAFGDIIESINLTALHRLACFIKVSIMRRDASLLECVQVTDDSPRSRRIVHIHNACRHAYRQAVCHQRGKEDIAEYRCYYHAEEVNGPGNYPTQLAYSYPIQTFMNRYLHNSLFRLIYRRHSRAQVLYRLYGLGFDLEGLQVEASRGLSCFPCGIRA